MTTLKDDVENLKFRIRNILREEVPEIQRKHGVGISAVVPEMIDCQKVGGCKNYMVGDIKIEVDV